MFRPLLWSVRSGTHRSIAVRIVMNMAVTGVVITIVTDSIAFPVTVGTVASAGSPVFARVKKIGRLGSKPPEGFGLSASFDVNLDPASTLGFGQQRQGRSRNGRLPPSCGSRSDGREDP